MKIVIAFLAAVLAAAAQDIKMPPGLEKLAAKAAEAAEVNLDGGMLRFASGALSDKDPDQAKAKKIVSGLKGIYIRTFEFEKEGEYNAADLDALRAQLKAPVWNRMVGVKSKGGENADVYFKDAVEGQIGGLFIIAQEPKELTVVNIVGTLRAEDVAELSGEFGIPKLDVQKKTDAQKKGKD